MAQNEPEYYNRPPSELNSFIIRVAHGCPHNQCTFCNMYKTVPFRPIPVEEVMAGIEQDAEENREFLEVIKSIYLEGGDPPALPVPDLLRIMSHAREHFPALTRFACYATAKTIANRTPGELAQLAQAGLRRVFIGLESGSDRILRHTRKGCTRADLLLAGGLLAGAGIENDVSMMLGIGGKAFSEEHILATASLLNEIKPVCVRIRTFVPKKDTPLAAEYLDGSFLLQEPEDSLRELRLMVENIHSPMQLLSEHWTDFLRFNARMPEARDLLLKAVDNALQLPRSAFRSTGLASKANCGTG